MQCVCVDPFHSLLWVVHKEYQWASVQVKQHVRCFELSWVNYITRENSGVKPLFKAEGWMSLYLRTKCIWNLQENFLIDNIGTHGLRSCEVERWYWGNKLKPLHHWHHWCQKVTTLSTFNITWVHSHSSYDHKTLISLSQSEQRELFRC